MAGNIKFSLFDLVNTWWRKLLDIATHLNKCVAMSNNLRHQGLTNNIVILTHILFLELIQFNLNCHQILSLIFYRR